VLTRIASEEAAMLKGSEFTDEYQDWLDGSAKGSPKGSRFHRTLAELEYATPLVVERAVSLASVIELMNARRETAVLVLDGERLIGIFTERDALTRVLPRGLDIHRTSVDEVMTESPHALDESTLLTSALRTLALAGYHHLPVVDAGGRPKGVVSLQTIVRFLVDEFPAEIMNAPPERDSFPPAVEGA
jgi:CBS domain-containing protein